MIDWYQAVVLALLQGLTEFLPVSSSAHLLFPSLLLGWSDQGLAFDVAVHVGTLSAVLLYYRDDLVRMANHWLRSLAGAPACDDSRMVWYLALATVPAGLAGLIAGDFIEDHLRILPVLATTTLVFGLLLGFADRRARHATNERHLSGNSHADWLVTGSGAHPGCLSLRYHHDGRSVVGLESTIRRAIFFFVVHTDYCQRRYVENLGVG